MILGYISIALTVVLLIALSVLKAKAWVYYAGIYTIGALLLLSTSLASSQLIGSDIHLEYYYASQSLMNGWDTSLPCTINSCFPIVIGAPTISRILHIDLIWIFKVIYPLFYALVPVLLLYIYSRFMSLKWAFLSAMVYVIVPVFFLEMPAISRQMIAILIVVSMIALLMSNIKHEYKMGGLLLGSIMVIVTHYSTATFWFVILAATVIGFYVSNQKWRTLDIAVILGISIGVFFWYSNWSSSGWQMVDYGNTVQGLANVVTSGQIIEGSTSPGIGTPSSTNINWIPIILTVILIFGAYRLLKNKDIPKLYKVWIISAMLMLVIACIYPAIANTINFTRYYHLMLIFLAPAVVFTFYKWIVPTSTACLVIVFLFSSGLIFNLLGFDNIERSNIPYSIALENKCLDAGNYLTSDDRAVSKWASENGIKEVYGDLGGTLAMQDYLSLYQTKQLADTLPNSYIFLRSWNTEYQTLAYWVGPGLREQKPLLEIDRPIVYQSGNAILYGVK